jgi:hypothetical protein
MNKPSIVMDKLKISTWGTLPHIRKQTNNKIRQKSSNTFKSSGLSFIPINFNLSISIFFL